MVGLYYLDQNSAQTDQIIENNQQKNLDPQSHPEMQVKEETWINTQSQIDFDVNKTNANEESILNKEETKNWWSK